MNNILKTDYESLADEAKKNLETLVKQGVKPKRTAFSIFSEMGDVIRTLSDEGFSANDIANSLKTTKLGSMLTEKTILQYVQRTVGKRKNKQRKNRKPTATATAAVSAPKTETNAPATPPAQTAKPTHTAPATSPVSAAKPAPIPAITNPEAKKSSGSIFIRPDSDEL